MKIAILLRGHTYLKRDRFGYPMDARTNYQIINDNLIQPIKELYPNTQVFFRPIIVQLLKNCLKNYSPVKSSFKNLLIARKYQLINQVLTTY